MTRYILPLHVLLNPRLSNWYQQGDARFGGSGIPTLLHGPVNAHRLVFTSFYELYNTDEAVRSTGSPGVLCVLPDASISSFACNRSE